MAGMTGPGGQPINNILQYNNALNQGNSYNPSSATWSNNNVLGASTGPTNSGGSSGGSSQQMQNGGWYNGKQYWAPGQGPQANAGGSSSAGPSMPNVDDIWNPVLSNLQSMAGDLGSTKAQQLGGVDTQYAGQQKTIQSQLSGLQNQLSTDTSTFGNQVQSAVAQAARDYQALQQRNMSMFGGQSSAGGAADEVLADSYNQARAGLQNTQLQGNQQLQQQGLDVNTWGDQQNNQLDTWKSQAYDQINNVFQQGMNQINQDTALAQSQKAQAKMDLLNQVVQHRQAIDDYHTQLQGQLQAALTMSGANAGTYNSQPFMSQFNQLTSGIPQQVSGLEQMAQTAGLPQQQAQNFVYSLGSQNPNAQNQRDQTMMGFAQ